MSNYMVRLEDGRYVDGIVAGLATEADVIGYIGGFAIPVVVRAARRIHAGSAVCQSRRRREGGVDRFVVRPAQGAAGGGGARRPGRGRLGLRPQLASGSVGVAEKRGLGFVGYGCDRQGDRSNAWLSSFVFI